MKATASSHVLSVWHSLCALVLAAANGYGATWTFDGDGSWSEGAKWSAASAPDGEGAGAEGYQADYKTQTTILDMAATVGKLWQDRRSAWTIARHANAYALTLDDSDGTANIYHNSRASLTIAVDLILGEDLLVSRTGGSASSHDLTLGGAISGDGTLSLYDSDSNQGEIHINGPVNHVGPIIAEVGGSGTYAEIAGTIGGNVTSLTKLGTHGLILSGAGNAYTGGTFVNAGILQISSVSALGAPAPLEIDTGAKLTLNAATGAVQGTMTSLKLGGVAQNLPGTYGSTASGADHPDDTYFGGTGVVVLLAPSGTVVLVQ